jgi:hypothetical protein
METFGPATSCVTAAEIRVHSSAGERSLHTGEVQGSIPCAPTIANKLNNLLILPAI